MQSMWIKWVCCRNCERFPCISCIFVSCREAHNFQTSIVHISINVDLLVLFSDRSPYSPLNLSSSQDVRGFVSSRSFAP